MSPSDGQRARAARPVPLLVVAAVLVAAEGLAALAVGASVVVGAARSRLVLDVTTTVFFAAYGAGLLACARGLLRVRRWARAPVVLAQLIQILVAWSFYPGQTRPIALLLAGVGLAVLVTVLAPPATRALVSSDETTPPT